MRDFWAFVRSAALGLITLALFAAVTGNLFFVSGPPARLAWLIIFGVSWSLVTLVLIYYLVADITISLLGRGESLGDNAHRMSWYSLFGVYTFCFWPLLALWILDSITIFDRYLVLFPVSILPTFIVLAMDLYYNWSFDPAIGYRKVS